MPNFLCTLSFAGATLYGDHRFTWQQRSKGEYLRARPGARRCVLTSVRSAVGVHRQIFGRRLGNRVVKSGQPRRGHRAAQRPVSNQTCVKRSRGWLPRVTCRSPRPWGGCGGGGLAGGGVDPCDLLLPSHLGGAVGVEVGWEGRDWPVWLVAPPRSLGGSCGGGGGLGGGWLTRVTYRSPHPWGGCGVEGGAGRGVTDPCDLSLPPPLGGLWGWRGGLGGVWLTRVTCRSPRPGGGCGGSRRRQTGCCWCRVTRVTPDCWCVTVASRAWSCWN